MSLCLSIHPLNKYLLTNCTHHPLRMTLSLPSALTSLLSSGYCILWIGKSGTFWLYNSLPIICSYGIYLRLDFYHLMCVFVCLGCYNKNTRGWMTCKQRTFCGKHSSASWKFKIMVPVDSVSEEGPLPRRWCLLWVSSHGGRGRLALQGLLQGQESCSEAPPSYLGTPTRAHCPVLTLGVRISAYEFGGGLQKCSGHSNV